MLPSLSADAPTTAATFNWKSIRKERGGEKRKRQETTHQEAFGSARLSARRGKSLRGRIQLCVVESPFVYTCDRWMGRLLAAPSSFRSPKSPALSKSNNYVRKTLWTAGGCVLLLKQARRLIVWDQVSFFYFFETH